MRGLAFGYSFLLAPMSISPIPIGLNVASEDEGCWHSPLLHPYPMSIETSLLVNALKYLSTTVMAADGGRAGSTANGWMSSW